VTTTRRELTESRRRIESQTGAPCRHFCYPYGGCSPEVQRETAAAGYSTAVTTLGPGWNAPGADLFGLRRFTLVARPAKLSRLLLS
jgi:hypothetical protein